MAYTGLDNSAPSRTPLPRTIRPLVLACSTCQGHLVADLYIDMVDAGGHVWIRALRCVRCGTIEEAGRAGFGSPSHAGKRGGKRQGKPQKGMDDEMTALGT